MDSSSSVEEIEVRPSVSKKKKQIPIHHDDAEDGEDGAHHDDGHQHTHHATDGASMDISMESPRIVPLEPEVHDLPVRMELDVSEDDSPLQKRRTLVRLRKTIDDSTPASPIPTPAEPPSSTSIESQNSIFSSSASNGQPTSSASSTARSSSPVRRRKRLHRLVDSDEEKEEVQEEKEHNVNEQEEEQNHDDHDEEEQEEDDDEYVDESKSHHSPRTRRYATRGVRSSGAKLGSSELSALQRLKAEREGKLDSNKRRCLGVGISREEAARASRFARAEQIIHGDVDESEEDEVVTRENTKYFNRAKGSYDPLKEDREMRRIEEAQAERQAAEEALKQKRMDEAYERHKQKLANKKQRQTKPRAARSKKEDLDSYDEDDGFVSEKKTFDHLANGELRFIYAADQLRCFLVFFCLSCSHGRLYLITKSMRATIPRMSSPINVLMSRALSKKIRSQPFN